MDGIPTYTIYTPGNEGEALFLATQGLNRQQIEDALHIYATRENIVYGTLLGVALQGVIFTPEKNWRRDKTNNPTVIRIVPWEHIQALLGLAENK